MKFIVQAVHRRKPVVDYLQRHIPGLQVIWDTSGSASRGYLNVLRAAGAEPAVTLEDDIIITKGFVPKILNAIEKKPKDLIQFHSRTLDDIRKGSRYRNGLSFFNRQCLYLPAGFAETICKYGSTHSCFDPGSPAPSFDYVFQDFLKKELKRYWVSIPSLVDHLPDRSAIDPRRGRYGKQRQARVFEDPELEGCPPNLLSIWKPMSQRRPQDAKPQEVVTPLTPL